MRNDDELRRLLREGPTPAEDEKLAQVLRELRYALSSPPPEQVAEEHLTAITAAATGAAHEAPTVVPGGRLRAWGRRVAAAGALKIATATTVAAAATGGGLAATGSLPQPLQEHVSDVLSGVGIEIPSGTDTASEERPGDLGTTPAGPAVVDSAPPTPAPPVETPADDVAEDTVPEDAPVDERAPFLEPPAGEPSETPSDADAGHRTERPDPAEQAPDAPAERSTGDPRGTQDAPPEGGTGPDERPE